ncbi:RNA polymerase sigma factor [Luethyella okanaganae]|uniref:RNA polymerase sigma factor n=1 Tax=Luethyella okanaganae TaxID=69372 RepID=A0ABW1VEU5_9MICO
MGDVHGFDEVGTHEVYVRVAPELRRFLFRGGTNPQDVDDVVAETFSVYLDALGQGSRRIENPRAYLFAVARNLSARGRFEQGRVVVTDDDFMLDLEVQFPDVVSADLERTLVDRALAELTADQRRVLQLTMIEDRSTADAAREMAITRSSVTTIAFRARAAFREAYIRAFLEEGVLDCGFSTKVIAKVVLGTASARQRAKFEQHRIACPDCDRIAQEALAEARSLSFPATLAALLLGSVTLARTALDPMTESSALIETGSGTGRGRRALGYAVLLVAFIVALVALFGGPSVREGVGNGLGRFGDSVGLFSAPTAPDISATPERARMRMPAPGHSESWEMSVQNVSEVDAPVALDVIAAIEAGPEHVDISVYVGQTLIADGLRLADFSGRYLYLGTLAPGRSMVVTGVASRDARDTDQGLSADAVFRFLTGAEAPDARPGEFVGADGMADGGLPQTGWGVSWLIAAGAVLAATGALLVVASRRRRDAD